MRRMPAPRVLVAALAALAATGLAACGGDEGSSAVGESQSALVQEPTPLEHIHGVGINPADGRLFIATHNGLFTAAEGESTPTQVGTTEQDIMGFSVVGPNRLVGSGHPDPVRTCRPRVAPGRRSPRAPRARR